MQRNWMPHLKPVAVIGTALFLLPVTDIKAEPPPPPPLTQAAGPATKVQGDLVNIRADAYWDTPGVPLLSLIGALKDYPSARLFRVSWSLLVFSNSTNTTVLYDRHRHSLTLYSTGGGDVVGSYRDHVRFTNVPEFVFGKIVKAHRNDMQDTDSWSLFSDLPRYGCRKQDLGSWRKAPRN